MWNTRKTAYKKPLTFALLFIEIDYPGSTDMIHIYKIWSMLLVKLSYLQCYNSSFMLLQTGDSKFEMLPWIVVSAFFNFIDSKYSYAGNNPAVL